MGRNPNKPAIAGWTCLLTLLWVLPVHAFSFSEHEREQQAEEQARQQRTQSEIADNLNVSCPASARHRRIMVILSEAHQYGIQVLYHFDARSGQLFREINQALGELGLKTYTPQQIKQQIAEAELQAVANGDVDAAISAASRLGADYILRANINKRFARNFMIGIMEVSVNMHFELQSASGSPVGATSAGSESFSGDDTLSVAHALVREHARSIASRLYRDLCRYEAAKPH